MTRVIAAFSLVLVVICMIFLDAATVRVAMIAPFIVNLCLAANLFRLWKDRNYANVFGTAEANMFFVHLFLWILTAMLYVLLITATG